MAVRSGRRDGQTSHESADQQLQWGNQADAMHVSAVIAGCPVLMLWVVGVGRRLRATVLVSVVSGCADVVVSGGGSCGLVMNLPVAGEPGCGFDC